VILWYGTADPLTFFRGSVDYYQRLEAAVGGADQARKFARFFVAPGVGPCGGGQGAAPADQLEVVVRWVEHGQPPDTLPGRRADSAGTVVFTRPVCQYPLVARSSGHGATTKAANFTCAGGFR
jgi:hypothetical protein